MNSWMVTFSGRVVLLGARKYAPPVKRVGYSSFTAGLYVMSAIPFGHAGAIIGHIIMGHPLSIISLFGLLALAGVVVNDSLVMVDYINGKRAGGMGLHESVISAGGARFRAIMLTSVTTFVGLMPMMFETSLQAQFLIPMAISLGYGILFSTFITLFLLPINFLILEDMRRLWRWYWQDEGRSEEETGGKLTQAQR